MATLSIQNIFDSKREVETKIKNLKIKLEELKNQEEKLRMNLIKSKKIKWVECDLNSWREYVEKNRYEDPATYYIYYNDGDIYQQGYYEGVHKLNEDEFKHFEEYLNDYFYYGYPMYLDRNEPFSSATECELAFGGGSSYLKEFNWD